MQKGVRSEKILILLTIFVLWSQPVFSASITNVIYVNGIQNTLAEARASANVIVDKLKSSNIRSGEELRKFSVSLVWNPIGWFGDEEGPDLEEDKAELFLLKTAEEYYIGDFEAISLPYNQKKAISKAAAQRVKVYLDDMTPGNNSLEARANGSIDEVMHLTQVAALNIVSKIKRMGPSIVVAHSQGNLLVNLAWASYASEIGDEIAQKMRVVNVANTSRFSVNSLNLTHAGDFALFNSALSLESLPFTNSLDYERVTPVCRGFCNFVLAPPTFGNASYNFSIGNPLSHGFVDTYMSDNELPTILVSNGVHFSLQHNTFKDRFEDLVYAAALSLEINQPGSCSKNVPGATISDASTSVNGVPDLGNSASPGTGSNQSDQGGSQTGSTGSANTTTVGSGSVSNGSGGTTLLEGSGSGGTGSGGVGGGGGGIGGRGSGLTGSICGNAE